MAFQSTGPGNWASKVGSSCRWQMRFASWNFLASVAKYANVPVPHVLGSARPPPRWARAHSSGHYFNCLPDGSVRESASWLPSRQASGACLHGVPPVMSTLKFFATATSRRHLFPVAVTLAGFLLSAGGGLWHRRWNFWFFESSDTAADAFQKEQ